MVGGEKKTVQSISVKVWVYFLIAPCLCVVSCFMIVCVYFCLQPSPALSPVLFSGLVVLWWEGQEGEAVHMRFINICLAQDSPPWSRKNVSVAGAQLRICALLHVWLCEWFKFPKICMCLCAPWLNEGYALWGHVRVCATITVDWINVGPLKWDTVEAARTGSLIVLSPHRQTDKETELECFINHFILVYK